jgi:cadmium resistance protein CadD (predicted permease)
MATWLILVLAALVLAVIGATTAATWLLALGVAVLVIGVVWALVGRSSRGDSTTTGARTSRGGGR